LGWALAFPLGLQSDGIWFGMASSNVICGVVALVLLAGKRWLRPRIKVKEPVELPADA